MFIDKPYYMNRRDNPNSSVKNKEKVYCMNIEYDFIREIFMQKGNEKLWERFRPYYTYKKYYSYVFTLGRISSEFTEEYLDRMSREFKRAFDLGEVDLSVFTPYTQKAIELLVKDPQGYYQRYILKKGSGPVNILRRLRRFLGKVKRGIGRRIKKR